MPRTGAAQQTGRTRNRAYRKKEGVLGAASLQVEVIDGLPVVFGELHSGDEQGKGDSHSGQHDCGQRKLPV